MRVSYESLDCQPDPLGFPGLRGIKGHTRDVLDQALAKFIDTIGNRDAREWFAHCGYALH
jgi:hypothetical protein